MITIKITPNKTLKEIQEEFSKRFTHLKLEFFSKPHSEGKGTQKEYMKDNLLQVKDLASADGGSVEISGNTIVSELEKAFRETFGLYVQVFRKSGKIWLETTATDGWTLSYQNSQGEELDNTHLLKDKEESD